MQQSDISGMTARVLCDYHRAFDGLSGELRGNAQHLLVIRALFTCILAEFFGHLINCETLALDTHENFTFIEQALLVNDTNEDS